MSREYSAGYEIAKNEQEAACRFEEFSSKDPLPEVPPALLNSGDIHDYARITSMVYPFEEKKLKSASYEVDFLGKVHYVNEESEVEVTELEKHKPFTLKKNSIAFLYIQTKFFLPDYIAIRFNLKITHVHRGLLLGTGPLVDPGFVGRLLIPLHNLTSKDYAIKGGDGLIWVEFTKLSPHRNWNTSAREDSAAYKSFPSKKRNLPVQVYFNKASPQDGRPASSSIPGEIAATKKHAKDAEQHAKDAANRTKWISIATILGLITLVFMTWDLISATNQHIATARDLVENLSAEKNNINNKIESLEIQIRSLTESLEKKNKGFPKNAQENYPNDSSH
ncbi:hypothetical protein [Nitrosomonas halophila]|uniref:Deoxycytidine triphosphate deaminase n=1 Tax=Nitrosomonas halophila TaxID=44576 RepID=A0A1H3DU70_9PROT|nr:hypothetical protein [Nitrosomonas halophila]SDX69214.1 Deoxycytidine triphosphate deaminase [Nitrosomonas halophila]